MDNPNVQMRDAFISELHSRARSDRDIVMVTNDQGAATLDGFVEELPGQFINAGISEQNILSVSAGMALGGKKVFVYSIASFITLRGFEQIKIDLCAMSLPVTILGVGSGYSYSTDGPTHHATEDIAIMRTLRNMTIYNPADSYTAAALVDISLDCKTPAYIRLDREQQQPIYDFSSEFCSGFTVLGEDERDVCIVSTGSMVRRAIEVAERLNATSIATKVIDVYRLKPIEAEKLINAVSGVKMLVTVEEHTLNGGLGSIVSELLTDFDLRIPLKRLGIKDEAVFGYGPRPDLHKERGLDVDSIERTIREYLS
jgi:transketolase